MMTRIFWQNSSLHQQFFWLPDLIGSHSMKKRFWMKWRNISDIFVMCIWSEFGSRFDSIADFVFAAVQEGHFIRTGKGIKT